MTSFKWNPHVHMMVTEGGVGNHTEGRHIRHIPYESLRKRWQKILLDEISIFIGDRDKARKLKNKLYKDNKFYVHAKTEIKSASRRSKGKNNFIKMIDEKILSLRKLIANWQNRILATFGVDPCKCANCNSKMVFNDIVYPKYGSMRKYFRRKIIKESEEKLEEALRLYSITKGVLCGRINPEKT